MIKYKACFIGVVIGSKTPLGDTGWLNVDIEAEDEDEARGKLYQTHENIRRLFWLWPGKQTVREFKEHDHRQVVNCRRTDVYVSTYNGHSWLQTECSYDDVEHVKATHLANTTFMDRHGLKEKALETSSD